MELIGPYLVACALLLIAGVMKVVRPDDTARAVALVVPDRLRRPLQFRVLRVLIRIGALAEVALGTVAIFLPRPLPAALVATSYAVFVGMVLYVRSRGGSLASCGCFGTLDTPATRLHAVINLGLVIPAVAVAMDAPAGGSTVEHHRSSAPIWAPVSGGWGARYLADVSGSFVACPTPGGSSVGREPDRKVAMKAMNR